MKISSEEGGEEARFRDKEEEDTKFEASRDGQSMFTKESSFNSNIISSKESGKE